MRESVHGCYGLHMTTNTAQEQTDAQIVAALSALPCGNNLPPAGLWREAKRRGLAAPDCLIGWVYTDKGGRLLA